MEMAGNIRLLIVDDEVKFLDSIAKRLELRGLEVTKATNGRDAVASARQQKFDLALLDLKMPGMDGAEVLKVLKEEHNFLEIIILTGHGSLESAVECTKLGAYGYLPKPYEFDSLLDILKEAYEVRMRKKFESNQAQLQKIMDAATGNSALGILRSLKELDDDEK
jgi:DNA-binding NtrC family response regulator